MQSFASRAGLDQRVGRETTDVHAASTLPIDCGTAVRSWRASMGLTAGSFVNGSRTTTVEPRQARRRA